MIVLFFNQISNFWVLFATYFLTAWKRCLRFQEKHPFTLCCFQPFFTTFRHRSTFVCVYIYMHQLLIQLNKSFIFTYNTRSVFISVIDFFSWLITICSLKYFSPQLSSFFSILTLWNYNDCAFTCINLLSSHMTNIYLWMNLTQNDLYICPSPQHKSLFVIQNFPLVLPECKGPDSQGFVVQPWPQLDLTLTPIWPDLDPYPSLT